MLDNYKELYEKLPFFNYFKKEEKEQLVAASFPKVFEKEWKPDFCSKISFDDLYIIIDGTVDILDAGGKSMKTLKADDYFGSVWPVYNAF